MGEIGILGNMDSLQQMPGLRKDVLLLQKKQHVVERESLHGSPSSCAQLWCAVKLVGEETLDKPDSGKF